MITLRNYQERAVSQLKTTGQQVLSICPGGGKTYTSIEFALRNPQFKKVLILTHGTNVLKSQWSDDFDTLNIPYSTDISSNERFTITIPQAIINCKIPEFDLVIMDEAHEFFFITRRSREVEEGGLNLGMINKILKQVKPVCTLFLTGTPSKFIKNNYEPVIISGCEIFGDIDGKKYLSDTYFGMVKSSYSINDEDFSEDGETKTSVDFSHKDTEDSLNSLVDEMLKRLRANSLTKKLPNIVSALGRAKLGAFQEAFGGLGKTLIAARNIEHANRLKDILLKKGINVIASESDSDKDSENVAKFKDVNSDTQVLIVVRRGVLGFNMPTLINVIDFTMSRNIDRIYQLYARVLRVHPEGKNKFYFKMCSRLNPSIDSLYFQAALCLNNLSFISKYNGKNLKSLPILTSTKKKKLNNKSGVKSKGASASMDEDMMEGVISLSLMTELTINPNSKHWKEFEYTSFNSALSKLKGVEFKIDWSTPESAWQGLMDKGVVDEKTI